MRVVSTRHRAEKITGDLLVIHILDAGKEAFVTKRNFILRAAIITAGICLALLLGHLRQHFTAQHLAQDRFLDLQAPQLCRLLFILRPCRILATHHDLVVGSEIKIIPVQQLPGLLHSRANPLLEDLINRGCSLHALALQNQAVHLAAVGIVETVHILLREIQPLEIQILQIVIKKSPAQSLVEWQPREMVVLQHDRHLPADLVEVRLLGIERGKRRQRRCR